MAMRPYNEFEVARARLLKAYRAAIRLKHSLAADEEIALTLPQVEEAVNTALLTGEPVAINVATAFEDSL